MTAPRKPARTGAAPQGWQAAFLVSLRQTGNVSAAARAAGTLKVGYVAASQSAKDSEDASTKQDNHEIGAELSTGDLTFSAITFKQKATPNKGSGKVEQSGQEAELAYNASDSLTVNLVYFTAEVDEGGNKDDTYKWTGVGAKYTIAPGLWSSLSYKTFDYTDKSDKAKNNSGNAIRLRVHVGF